VTEDKRCARGPCWFDAEGDSISEVEAFRMAMETMSRVQLHLSSVFQTVQVLRSGAKLRSTSQLCQLSVHTNNVHSLSLHNNDD
jgi:hypothetical protein